MTLATRTMITMVAVVSGVLLFFPHLFSAAEGDEALRDEAMHTLGTLPAVMTSVQNPITPEKVALGKVLFYEARISIDGTTSCVRCHPFSLYGADGLRKSIGNRGQVNPRNAPTVFNAAAQIAAHWIGNRRDAEDQAKQAVTGPLSFGMPSNQAVEEKLRQIPGYTDLFKKAFPGEQNPVTIDNFANAVGAFERTLVTLSPFDAFLKGDARALSQTQKAGLRTFMAVGCSVCHTGPYVGGQAYQKFGIIEPYWKLTKSEPVDEGRHVVTRNDADKYMFKVPVLRNVAKTAPYFHDGSIDGLQEAIRIMGKIQVGRDLSDRQVEEIASFLQSLTGTIPENALTIPVLPSLN